MGLIDNAMPGQLVAAPTPAPEPAATPATVAKAPADSNVIYKKLGLAAMAIIYDKNMSQRLVEMMKTGKDDPATVVAHAAMTILGRMKQSVKGIDPKTVFSVAPMVVVLLLELGIAAKLFKDDPEMIKAALDKLATLTQSEDQPQEAAPVVAPNAPPGMPAGGTPAMMPQGA